MSVLKRNLRPPPGRRSYKVPASSSALPLLYLGWGRRRFGEAPVPLGLNLGWVYAIVLEGTPLLLAGGQRRTCRPGDAFILGEECPMGWKDEPGASCRILVWIWRTAPTLELLMPEAAGCRHWTLDPRRLDEVNRCHRECRRELAAPDEFAGQALEGAQRRVDVAWLRALAASSLRDQPETTRYEAGLNWMRHNLAARQPVSELAVYLGVSEATLQRIFKRQGGRGPLAAFQELKAREARLLLEEGRPVKDVAWRLGYRHANDFSRFYRKTFGEPPSTRSGRRGFTMSARVEPKDLSKND